MSETEVIRTIRERLQSLFDVRRIVLFGSRGRGDAQVDSDYDVLVLVDSDVPFVARQAAARQAVGRVGAPLDLLVYTPSEAERAEQIPGTALYWAAREGKEVYAR